MREQIEKLLNAKIVTLAPKLLILLTFQGVVSD